MHTIAAAVLNVLGVLFWGMVRGTSRA